MNILIVKLSAVGDVIHTLPSLAALRKLYPGAHVTWVVEEAAADIILGHPDLDSVVVSRRKSWQRALMKGHFKKALSEMGSFLRDLRVRDYDLVIDFHGLFKSAVLVFLCRGKRKIGYDSYQELSGFFYSEKITEDMDKHAVNRYLDFPKYLGAKIEEPVFQIAIGDANKEKVDELLALHQVVGPFVAMNPVAYWDTKLWDNECFASLCDRIVETYGIFVVLTGQKAPSLGQIQRLARRNVLNLEGRTSLKDLAELYRRAALLVTTDSGPMHLAAALGTPVVALFGPTDPKRTGPHGSGHIVLQEPLSCAPCFRKFCREMTCMKKITVNAVFNEVKKLLEERL
ncbi:MAG: glycosyltransferase family 9 protein [Syntrophales bacterium]|jgi:3-deoxy-D-manno-octulosonic-acid transferase/heptosyltransferase-1|nr:glycosyltransferase family 9 protein [Syntrophales bacterium]